MMSPGNEQLLTAVCIAGRSMQGAGLPACCRNEWHQVTTYTSVHVWLENRYIRSDNLQWISFGIVVSIVWHHMHTDRLDVVTELKIAIFVVIEALADDWAVIQLWLKAFVSEPADINNHLWLPIHLPTWRIWQHPRGYVAHPNICFAYIGCSQSGLPNRGVLCMPDQHKAVARHSVLVSHLTWELDCLVVCT